MSIISLNKPVSGSNFHSPFLPEKAIDGIISPTGRWVSSVLPAWLSIDLQNNYYVIQYSLMLMGSVGWNPWNYNIKSFKLQGSLDGGTWFDMDIVSNNTDSTINKNITPAWTRYLRIYITEGLNCNKQVSSIVDFQATEPDNVPLLSGLTSSAGTLSSVFNSRNLIYSINVENATSAIAFTPTTSQTGMEIKVGNNTVNSGVKSPPIELAVGSNTINITVKNGAITTTYAVIVTRTGLASYLNSIEIKDDSDDIVVYNPAFSKTIFSYTATVSKFTTSVSLKPLSEDPAAVVKVNNVIVSRGQSSAAITLNTGPNTITISVNSSSYIIVITKQS